MVGAPGLSPARAPARRALLRRTTRATRVDTLDSPKSRRDGMSDLRHAAHCGRVKLVETVEFNSPGRNSPPGKASEISAVTSVELRPVPPCRLEAERMRATDEECQ